MMNGTGSSPPLLNEHTRQRAMSLALVQGMLGTVGGWLMGGMTLNYFAMELGAKGKMLGIVLAVGNIASILRLVVPYFVNRSDNRKRVWLYANLLARLISIGFPLLAFAELRPAGIDPLWLLVGLLCTSTVAGAISDVAWLSWFADVVPEEIWGRYFARRNMWMVPAAMIVQVGGGLAVDAYTSAHPEKKLVIYAVLYGLGIAFNLMAIIPMLFVPNLKLRSQPAQASLWTEVMAPFCDVNFRRYAYFWCWLMLGSGVPQAAFQLYQKNYLLLGLLMANSFQVVNQLLNFMGLRLAGPLTDRFGNKPLIILGLIGAAAGPFFWLPTAPGGLQNYWIMYGAYVVWGAGWACVNLGSQNLMLKVAPRGNNVAYIAAAQGLGGVCVAICTVVGGNWLEHLQDTGFTFSLGSAQFNAYHLFFLLSFVGRSSAALWVFGIREPGASSIRQMIMTLRQRSTA